MVKVSIIIPVYNVEKFLKRCLESVINQTLKEIEIICVNDGSTDSSPDILDKFSLTDARIKVIHQDNAGICAARNEGVNAATGEFIGFLDSDDFVSKDFYEKLYNAAKKNNADIACSSVIRGNYKRHGKIIEYTEEKVATDIKEKFELAKLPKHCYVWNKIYNHKKLNESGIKFVRGMVYEDMLFTPDVIEALGKMVVVPNIQYNYWKQQKSLIKNDSDATRADKIKNKIHLLKKCRIYNVVASKKDKVLMKKEIYFCGVKLLKIYQYRATKEFYLFGIFPLLTIKDNV